MRNPNVHIRIMGDPETVEEVVNGLQIDENHFYKFVSHPYQNRESSDVRVYVTITAAAQTESQRHNRIGIEKDEDT